MTALPDFLIIGQEDWDEIWRRNQFLIAGLARRYPSARFLFVELPFDLTYGLRSRQIFRQGSTVRMKLAQLRQGVRVVAGFPNIYTLVLPKLLPDGLAWGHRGNCYVQSQVIQQTLKQLGIHRPVVWTQNPFAATLLAAFVDSKVIYDITDDWANLKGASRRFIERVKHGDAALTRRADCVIVCSKYLYELKKTVEVQPVLIPNGVDVAHYAWIGEPNAPSAAKMAEIQPPVLGYTGSLHEARLDIELVCALAAAQPHINLVLIGPSFLSVEAVARLTKFPNIHLIGPVPYRELPVYMQSFNALMIPHVVSDFTESLDPLKLYEYLAAGLPIVATNLAGVRDYAEVVRVAHSQTEFIEAVSLALNNRYSDEQAKARQLAQAASWHLRVDAVLQAISALEV